MYSLYHKQHWQPLRILSRHADTLEVWCTPGWQFFVYWRICKDNHSFDEYLLSSHDLQGKVLSAGNIPVYQRGKVPVLMELTFLGSGKLLVNKQTKINEQGDCKVWIKQLSKKNFKNNLSSVIHPLKNVHRFHCGIRANAIHIRIPLPMKMQ